MSNWFEDVKNKLFSFDTVKTNTTDDKSMKKIEKGLSKGKEIQVSNPTSYRSFDTGKGGYYHTGTAEIGKVPNMKQAARASSAVADVKYSPDSHICKVKFTNGDKYYDYDMTPDEFMDFMNSDSKGRHVNKVMHYENLMPGYTSYRN